VWSCVREFNVHVYAELMSVIDSAERQVGNIPAVLQVLCTAGGVLYAACTRWQRSHASPSIEWVLIQRCVQTPVGPAVTC
jgi:hypothetical protein